MNEQPRPPFPAQKQPMPGATAAMHPRPDHGEKSYKGSGKLKGLAITQPVIPTKDDESPDTLVDIWAPAAQIATVGIFIMLLGICLYVCRPLLVPIVAAVVIGVTLALRRGRRPQKNLGRAFREKCNHYRLILACMLSGVPRSSSDRGLVDRTSWRGH